MAGAGRHPQRRLMQLVLAMQWRLPWLCSQQEPPRPGNLTECMNWYDGQCPTCRCSTLLTVGYTCDSFAPGTEFQACEPPDLSRSLPVCLSVSVMLLVPPSRLRVSRRVLLARYRLRRKLPLRPVLLLCQRERTRRYASVCPPALLSPPLKLSLSVFSAPVRCHRPTDRTRSVQRSRHLPLRLQRHCSLRLRAAVRGRALRALRGGIRRDELS